MWYGKKLSKPTKRKKAVFRVYYLPNLNTD